MLCDAMQAVDLSRMPDTTAGDAARQRRRNAAAVAVAELARTRAEAERLTRELAVRSLVKTNQKSHLDAEQAHERKLRSSVRVWVLRSSSLSAVIIVYP